MSPIKFIPWIAVGLLGVATYMAAQYAREFYLDRARLKLAPTNEGQFAAENQRLPRPQGVRVVMFGDSRINGWDPKPEVDGFEFAWRGISGETTAQMIHRYRQDTSGAGAGVVVIQAGINDLVAGDALGRGEEAMQLALHNIQEMVRESADAGIDVVVLTVVRPAAPPLWRRLVMSEALQTSVATLNSRLKEMAGPRVRVLDADSILSGESSGLPDQYAKDTLHFLPAAYVVLNQELSRMLKASPHAVQ